MSQAPNEPRKHLGALRQGWLWLARTAAWIGAVIAGFIEPPPVAAQGLPVRALGAFVVTVLVGIFLVVTHRFDKHDHANRWAVWTAVALLGSVAAWFLFSHEYSRRTCAYLGQERVIGTVYTQDAADIIRAEPHRSCHDLIHDFGGQVEGAWMEASIRQSYLILQALYLGVVVLAATCIIGIAQAIYCMRAA